MNLTSLQPVQVCITDLAQIHQTVGSILYRRFKSFRCSGSNLNWKYAVQRLLNLSKFCPWLLKEF